MDSVFYRQSFQTPTPIRLNVSLPVVTFSPTLASRSKASAVSTALNSSLHFSSNALSPFSCPASSQ